MKMDEIRRKVLEDVDPATRLAVRKKRRKALIRTLLAFAGIIFAILLIFQFIWGIAPVSGLSMYPTLHDGDLVLYSRVNGEYKAGDIVKVDRPDGKTFVKRVVATAGDVVNLEGGVLYVNGSEARYAAALGETKATGSVITYPYKVGDGEVFVLGDNRENSEDSRSFGAVALSDIKGKILIYAGMAK